MKEINIAKVLVKKRKKKVITQDELANYTAFQIKHAYVQPDCYNNYQYYTWYLAYTGYHDGA